MEDVLAEEMGQLLLNALYGTEMGDSMRIRALVHNKVMLILVDSGSSHSLSANPSFSTPMFKLGKLSHCTSELLMVVF
jgi:hypothetical protein